MLFDVQTESLMFHFEPTATFLGTGHHLQEPGFFALSSQVKCQLTLIRSLNLLQAEEIQHPQASPLVIPQCLSS